MYKKRQPLIHINVAWADMQERKKFRFNRFNFISLVWCCIIDDYQPLIMSSSLYFINIPRAVLYIHKWPFISSAPFPTRYQGDLGHLFPATGTLVDSFPIFWHFHHLIKALIVISFFFHSNIPREPKLYRCFWHPFVPSLAEGNALWFAFMTPITLSLSLSSLYIYIYILYILVFPCLISLTWFL